ncbi:hypothetical protein [Palleronia sp. LCG004]|uniref:hypothetical protein n=1 Tax=Palleronia sp. LCG004 TaxID=3079304 RepID=UPI002942C5ED|nr:hypothetical protein [Palleronia sp. LCG004]WOI57476.1 hypothetical protein RVY76_06755 [Palleronia sp. LCG004]
MIAALWSGQRTFVLDATSGGIEITFAGKADGEAVSSSAWQLRDVTVCRLRKVPDLRARATGEGSCPDTLYEITTRDELTVEWPAGTRLVLEGGTARGLVIRVLGGGSESFPADTVFVVPVEEWVRRGPLVFAGTAIVGGAANPNVNTLLLSGNWEARQSSLAAMPFRDTTDIVKSGRLTHGTRATLMNGKTPALVYGYITPSRNDGILEIALVSEPGDIALSIAQYGTARAVVLKPDLIDMLLSNPVLVALAIILALTEPTLSLLNLLGFKTSRTLKDKGHK